MKKVFLFFVFQLLVCEFSIAQNHTLPIPALNKGDYDPINNVWKFGLVMHEGLTQFMPGQQTITAGFNQYNFLGPTLEFRKGTNVQLNVLNLMNEVTTVHWHGIHLPAVMDGGPFQMISPGATWEPYWKVKDHAATFWYHPHPDLMTDAEVTKGLAGLIIVRDSNEDHLVLPRHYGADDIPLVILDRYFDSSNQMQKGEWGNTIITNGVTNAELKAPKQMVRFRILDASTFRSLNLAFSDNSFFSVIATDGGLLANPVPVQHYLLSPGERIEIVADFSNKLVGDSVNLVAKNDQINSGRIAGAWDWTIPAPNDSLEMKEFQCLHIVIDTYTSVKAYANYDTFAAIHSLPTAPLVANTFWDTSRANIQRDLRFNFAVLPGFLAGIGNTVFNPPFAPMINDSAFSMSREFLNSSYQIPVNNTEIWNISNNSSLAHVFHIHDVQFYIFDMIDSNNLRVPVPPEMKGWKDVVLVDSGMTIRFITKFEDYADSIYPFMYHCHMLGHEDGGMMGEFRVVNPNTTAIRKVNMLPESAVQIFPNPASDKIFIELEDKNSTVYYLTILDNVGRTKFMLPNPQLKDGLDVSEFKPGVYFMNIIDSHRNLISKKFIKE